MNRTSHLHRPGARHDEAERPEESGEEPRAPFAGVAGRFAQWFTGMDRVPDPDDHDDLQPGPEEEPAGSDPLQALTAGPAQPSEPTAHSQPAESSRFPLAPLGYSRPAVDQHLAELERELSDMDHELVQLRSQRESAPSITEELERIGEQTASILVVAHDKATETTRRAEEQAERCIAEAAANAVALTEGAKRRLQELDAETDAVWRERERLLEDLRAVSTALAALADQASERFPAAAEPAASDAGGVATATAPTRAPAAWTPQDAGAWPAGTWASEETAPGQDTVAFTAAEEAAARGEQPEADRDPEPDPQPQPWGQPGRAVVDPFRDMGDTASWLAGFEPPEPEPPR